MKRIALVVCILAISLTCQADAVLQQLITDQLAWINTQEDRMFEDVMNEPNSDAFDSYIDHLSMQKVFARMKKNEKLVQAIDRVMDRIQSSGMQTMNEVKESLQKMLNDLKQ